jgi:hypothetical protein
MNGFDSSDEGSTWKTICKFGGIASLVQVVCALTTLVVVFTLGGEPNSAMECFTMFRQDRTAALLRLDFASLINMVFYYFTVSGIYSAFRRKQGGYAALAAMFSVIGITLWISGHSAMSMVYLSDQYANASTPEARAQILAAGEAVLASNMWHGTGAYVAGYMLQISMLGLSILMLTNTLFGKLIAWLGIVTHGMDLIHIVIGPFLPAASVYAMMIAGTLYLPWFLLLGFRLMKIGVGHE